jgi:hypothetical protein
MSLPLLPAPLLICFFSRRSQNVKLTAKTASFSNRLFICSSPQFSLYRPMIDALRQPISSASSQFNYTRSTLFLSERRSLLMLSFSSCTTTVVSGSSSVSS